MHELSVTENIIALVQKHAETAQAKRVTDIHITVGHLASIVDDSVQFYWELLAKDTICQDAKLHFNRIPARMLCNHCGHSFILENELSPCPQCGSIRIKILSGEEFFLDSIEIEQ